MATIELRQVEKTFASTYAVKPLDLTIEDGEFLVLLGPSGCGKTTTLRMIAGLETTSGGRILFDGRDVTDKPSQERDISMVFQFFALYPHMSVRENIAFPLQAQGEKKALIRQRLDEVVALLEIEELLSLRPSALSGGDKQRVALARALVRRPAAFLMDEPLGALDAEFREGLRAEIKKLHLAQHATSVYVTHDQIEAMAMGDRIVVMSKAEVQQVGTPAEVYYDPANLFVARFIGSPGMNLISGEYAAGAVMLPNNNRYVVPEQWRSALEQLDGPEVVLGFRPEAASVQAPDAGDLAVQICAEELHGAYSMLHVALSACDDLLQVRIERGKQYQLGSRIKLELDPNLVRFFDPRTETALKPEVRYGRS